MITAEEVKKLASLARLEVKGEEAEKLRGDLNRILDYVGQVKELNPPSSEGADFGLPDGKAGVAKGVNVMREDTNPHPSGEFSESLLKAAPDRSGDYFKVKKILTRE